MRAVFIAVALGLVISGSASAFFALNELPPPSQYGNVLISRVENSTMPPVIFSHWRHRIEYTCRVCHLELEFEMKTNTTEINCQEDKSERFCRSCHNGKVAFDQGGDCNRCHNGDIDSGSEKFSSFTRLPFTRFGNRVNWVIALKRKMIRPRRSLLEEDYRPISFKKTLKLEAEWRIVPPAYFPHQEHMMWLDCENCHPHVFNIKKKTTQHFEMVKILEGRFCGACHLTVAFPIHDCKRCHPDIKEE